MHDLQLLAIRKLYGANTVVLVVVATAVSRNVGLLARMFCCYQTGSFFWHNGTSTPTAGGLGTGKGNRTTDTTDKGSIEKKGKAAFLV